MMQRLRLLIGFGVLAALLVPATAHAGTGASMACSDGAARVGGTEIPIIDNPITLAFEAGTPAYLFVCYSTTAEGSGSPALTGGYVAAEFTPLGVGCARDDNPLFVALECSLRDDNPGSTGRTLDVTITLQGTPVRIVAGIELGSPGPIACLFDTTIYLPTTTIGPVDIGVCA